MTSRAGERGTVSVYVTVPCGTAQRRSEMTVEPVQKRIRAPPSDEDALISGLSGATQWKLSPHAQLPPAFGLSIVKPCFWIVSSKSIEAPSR